MSQIRSARVTVFFALCILFLCLDSSLEGQTKASEHFNDLVGEALEATATPAPRPETVIMSPTGRDGPAFVGDGYLEAKLSYQFDGFNPDSYGHSVTLIMSYKF